MDIEKAKKVNKLAKELHSGLAISMGDAYAQASAIIDGNQPHPPYDASPTEDPLAIQERRFSQEIRSLRNDLASLSNDVVKLRSQIEQLQETSRQPKQEMPKPSQTPVPPVVPKEERTENEKSSHPRMGNYRPEDVAIDKMFYFGNK